MVTYPALLLRLLRLPICNRLQAATALANKVVHGSEADRDAYLGFLKAGSSNYPTEIMKHAGVDMTKPDYLEDAFKTFEKRLAEFESLIEK